MRNKSFIKGFFIAASLLCSLTACEYLHFSKLENRTGEPVQLIVQFNRKVFEKAWENRSYIPFLRQYGTRPGVTLEEFDSVTLISHYTIQNQSDFVIDQGVGGKIQRPTYDEFLSFKVISRQDTIIISNQRDFHKRFSQVTETNHIWTLK